MSRKAKVLTMLELARQVLKRHQPHARVVHDGRLANYCTDDAFKAWPCAEHQLAQAVLQERGGETVDG